MDFIMKMKSREASLDVVLRIEILHNICDIDFRKPILKLPIISGKIAKAQSKTAPKTFQRTDFTGFVYVFIMRINLKKYLFSWFHKDSKLFLSKKEIKVVLARKYKILESTRVFDLTLNLTISLLNCHLSMIFCPYDFYESISFQIEMIKIWWMTWILSVGQLLLMLNSFIEIKKSKRWQWNEWNDGLSTFFCSVLVIIWHMQLWNIRWPPTDNVIVSIDKNNLRGWLF